MDIIVFSLIYFTKGTIKKAVCERKRKKKSDSLYAPL